MFTSLTDPIKITASILLGLIIGVFVMVLVYEGVSLPLIGQVINGRVANAVDTATGAMVTTFERDALAAQLAKERRHRETAEHAAADAAKRADATQKAKELADDEVARLLAEARNLPEPTKEELEWLSKH